MLKIQKKDNRKAGKQGKQGIQGIQGKPGKDGLNGIDGTKWFNGDGKPSVSLGENGDFYLDDITSDYYQKIKDKWVLQGNLKGKKGDKGDKGERGDKGAKGDRGRDGGVGSPGADGAQGPQGETGAHGAQGNPGLNGEGVALGGTTGQILAKNSNTNFDTGWIDQPSGGGLAIGQTITNSPTVRGLLYSDDTDTLQNNLISIQQDSFFGGMVTAESFATETYSGFPSFGWVDATGFGQPGAVGVLTPGVNAQFYMMIDTTTLSAKAALNYNPGTPANSYFTIALANGLGGTPEFNVTTSLARYSVPITNIGDADLYIQTEYPGTDTLGANINIDAAQGNGTGDGGWLYLNAGYGGETGNGGGISMFAGNGGTTSGDGATLDIGAGYAEGSGDGGNTTVWAGNGAGGGTHGSIRFRYNGSTSATAGDVWELQDAATGAGAWATPAGASPGGSDTQVQYNDSGAFGGDAHFVFNETTNRITLGASSIAGSILLTDVGKNSAIGIGPQGDWGTDFAQNEPHLAINTLRIVGNGGAGMILRSHTNGNTVQVKAYQAAFDQYVTPSNGIVGYYLTENGGNNAATVTMAASDQGFFARKARLQVQAESGLISADATINTIQAKAQTSQTGYLFSGVDTSANHVFYVGVNGAAVFNEQGNDADFRVEGDTDANLIFGDASTDKVGIGTNAPAEKLEVNGTVRADGLRLDVTPTSETITPTHTITISVNGTNYKIPLQAA